ncbi:nucleotidyltransferase family protein [Thalassospira sp. MA62]|nr:nucleotidyltransferase family protein [Thalassospira sp. MA62]
MTKIAGLVVAAGASKRFGGRKQLADISGKAMVRHAIDAVSDACRDLPFVVLGAYEDEIASELNGHAHIVSNPKWDQGMGQSIATGIKAILDQAQEYEGVLIAVCDQVLLTADDYEKLINAFDRIDIAATAYEHGFGVPAVFPKTLWADLVHLDGDQGAKALINRRGQKVHVVDLPGALVDIDTPADLAALNVSSTQ